MKKYLFLIAATCALVSCAKEGFQESATPAYELSDNGANGKIISFSVEVEPSSETKATISSNTNFTWQSSDRAAVYTSDGTTKVELTPSKIEGGKATFTGEVPSGKTVAEGAIVVYPASFLTGPSSITFPDSYGDAAETKGQGTVLAAKVASGKNLSFKYLAATLRASITDVPSIATSITVTSTQTLTGVHTIDFTRSTPSLSTSSTAKVITFSSPANGNNVLIIPVPKTSVEQEFTYNVNYSSGVLFTQSTTKTLARNTYISMTPLQINPEVYLLNDLNNENNWTANSSTLLSVKSGTVYTASGLDMPIMDKYFRVVVKYPTDVWVNYSNPASDTPAGTSGVFEARVDSGWDKAALIHDNNKTYTITFNYLSGEYSVSSIDMGSYYYVNGINNNWTFTQNSSTSMTNICNNVFAWKGTTSHVGAKVFKKGGSGEGDYASDYLETMVNDGTTVNTLLFNPSDPTQQIECITDWSVNKVDLRGAFNSWTADQDQYIFSKTDYTGIWKLADLVLESDSEVKIVATVGENVRWYGGSTSDGYDVLNNKANYKTFVSGTDKEKNLKLEAGTYDLYFNDKSGRIYTVIK